MSELPTRRPWLLTVLSLFCLATVLFLVPRDLFIEQTRDVEVWLGFELRGLAAVLTAPIHWAIFLLGAWAAWAQKSWILPAMAGYMFYVALSHIVWSEVSPNGQGWPIGIAQAAAISVPAIVLLRVHRRSR
jgi:hypothetical protein